MQRQPLEFLRCKEIISRYVKEQPMQIVDIGGATGAFSYPLAQQGHHVHLLDFTPAHIEKAKENAGKYGVELTSYTCADARQTPYADAVFDLALVMGPMYHLQEREDRIACLQEAKRVVKKGGTILCEVISRYANLFEVFENGATTDPNFVEILQENLQTGKHNPADSGYFTAAFFHTPEQILEEIVQAGLASAGLVAVEGFAHTLNAVEILQNPSSAQLLLSLIRQTESIPALLGASGHIMAVMEK